MNYLQKKKLAFMSIVNQVKGFVRTVIGALPLTLEGCVDENSIIDYKIYGQSVQNGTPSPDNYVEVESVGDYDEETGKYKIPVYANGQLVTNILLNKPLYKVGSYADYIDFENKKVIRKVGVVEFDGKQNYPVYALPSQNFYGFYKSISNMKKGNRQEGLCTYFYNQKKTASRIWFGVGTNNIVYFSLPDIYNSAATDGDRMQAIKDWLAGLEKPFIVYYILAEETEQAIELSNIPTFKGTTIITADTTIQPSNVEIEYYSNVKE